VQAQYFSGEAMFRHQALVQRKFWTSLENPQK
jgi:shikimate 5-dehydrogenase